ncbi:adhesin, partial [Vibrio cholerae]
MPPQLGIYLDPIVLGGDNTFNIGEADDNASVTLSGTVSDDAKVGDTITQHQGAKRTQTTQVVELGGGKLCFRTSITADHLGPAAPELFFDHPAISVFYYITGYYAAADVKQRVTLSGTVRGDAKVGDDITLTLGEKSTLATQVGESYAPLLGIDTRSAGAKGV